jgi:hypothetical protein
VEPLQVTPRDDMLAVLDSSRWELEVEPHRPSTWAGSMGMEGG